MLKDVPIPRMFYAVQDFKKDHIEPSQIPAVIRRELSKPEIAGTMERKVSKGSAQRSAKGSNTLLRLTIDIVSVCFGLACALGKFGIGS